MYFSGFHVHHACLLKVTGRIITAVCLLYCAGSSPQTTIDLYGLSQHPGDGTYTHNGKSRNYNNRNWGIGLGKTISGPLYAISGVIQNSYYKTSVYAGAELLDKLRIHSGSDLKLTYGLRAFYITGYDDTPLEADKYLRAAFLQAGVEHNKIRLTLGFNEEASILFLSYTP